MTGEKKPVTAKFYGTTKEKMEIHSREEMDQVLAALKDAAFSVTDVKKGERTKNCLLYTSWSRMDIWCLTMCCRMVI